MSTAQYHYQGHYRRPRCNTHKLLNPSRRAAEPEDPAAMTSEEKGPGQATQSKGPPRPTVPETTAVSLYGWKNVPPPPPMRNPGMSYRWISTLDVDEADAWCYTHPSIITSARQLLVSYSRYGGASIPLCCTRVKTIKNSGRTVVQD